MTYSAPSQSPNAGFVGAWSQATALQSAVWSEGHALALFGSLAVWLVSSANIRVWLEKNRPAPRDLDFAAAGSSRVRIVAILRNLGYKENRELVVMTEGYLYRFFSPGRLTAEVRFDDLVFAHRIRVRGRFLAGESALALGDLLLSKLLIVSLTPPDLLDLFALVAADMRRRVEAPADWESDRQGLLAVLGSDWGAWYTASLSLARLEAAFDEGAHLPEQVSGRELKGAIRELQAALVACPKSFIWRARATIGRHIRWYAETSEPSAGEGLMQKEVK